MSYKKTTIKQAITDIDHKKIYLPALQRKFVWDREQIELLFDSLMRNYPFGTFLFWRLHREKAENYVFYEFLTEYDERNPYNHRKTGAFTHPEIIGVLDGQQRLSSMYIGLMGSHTIKTPYKRTWNPHAYEKKWLYLNLLSFPYTLDNEDEIVTREEQNFEFRFWTEAGADSGTSRKVYDEAGNYLRDEPTFWMKVGQVLSWRENPEFDQIFERLLNECSTEEQKAAFTEQRRFVKRGLDILHQRVQKDELINYFEVAKDDLEDILKIFVRVNSGGTVLSKTDLLFSTIVATWDDGREQIETLLKDINQKGDGFYFGNEFLMRCCLVLSDGPVIYKVNSFRSDNVQKIRDEWPRIAQAVSDTVDLLVEFGFNGGVLTSQNATIILAYYLHKGGDRSQASKDGMRQYLIHALLNGIFGSSQEPLLTTLRNAFREEAQENGRTVYRGRYASFSFDEVLKTDLPQQKSLAVSDEDLDRFLDSGKGPTSFFVLSLLYPQLRYTEVLFHQDHIHPASGFAEPNFRALGLGEPEWSKWWDRCDLVPNLQLMQGRLNVSKNATSIQEWVGQMTPAERTAFFQDNYFPKGVSLEFGNFLSFFDQRRELLRDELKKRLAMAKNRPEVSSAGDSSAETGEQESRIEGGTTE